MTGLSTADTTKTPEESNVVQSVEADNAAMLSSPKKEKILSVTVHLKNPTVFTLGYRSHDELYRRFQEKLNALGIPPDQIYLEDTMTGERLRIDRSMAEAWFFSWENSVDLYSPIYPVNELALFPLPRCRHHNHGSRHRSMSSSSSGSCHTYGSHCAPNGL
uniref:Glutaredoxin domain-containing protein n=1 Tax=Haemonchus contortus TaxID=6289 RepID=A0A7I4XZZ5_HAECO